MDCCNYGEWRSRGGYGSHWEGYGAYAPMPYAAYAPPYYAPPGPDYTRYAATAASYYYDYPAVSHHASHNEHTMAMDYGGYGSKEMRSRRSMARREVMRSRTPVQHILPPTTSPLECGLSSRGSYCDPHMWTNYQMGATNGWSSSASTESWASRSMQMRYPDFRSMKAPSLHALNQMTYSQDCKPSYPLYEEASSYASEAEMMRHNRSESVTGSSASGTPPRPESVRQRPVSKVENRPTPPPPIVEKRAPIVPLPAFQQAFGSTEIGKFAEAFARTEVSLEETFQYEQFPDWEPTPESQWTSAPREIKCEESY